MNAQGEPRTGDPDSQPRPSVEAHWYVRLGVLSGVVLGLAESAHRFALIRPQPFWLPSLWRAPVAYGVLCGLVGLWSAWRSTRTRANYWPAALAGHLGVALIAAILLYAPRVHFVAAVMLGAGTAIQVARLIYPHLHLIVAVCRRTETVLLITVAGLVISSNLAGHDRRAAASDPTASANPNVLLVVPDTVRAKSLSLHGYERTTTRHLSAWAKREVVFRQAFSTAPWTLPSHAGMWHNAPAVQSSAMGRSSSQNCTVI